MQIGRHFELGNRKYVGCDVSPLILDVVKKKFKDSNMEFIQLDAVHDDLPNGDLAIVKDVILHLSNQDVATLLEKLKKYRHVVLQTNIRDSDIENMDIQNGSFRSLDITKEPFNATDYKLTLTYTEGVFKPLNPVFALLGLPRTFKGVYVAGNRF